LDKIEDDMMCDDHLFALGRLREMMVERGVKRPPVNLIPLRNGFYKISDGRHRLARALLTGATTIEAVRPSDGHDSYIIAGGESNPGPPVQSKCAKDQASEQLLQKLTEPVEATVSTAAQASAPCTSKSARGSDDPADIPINDNRNQPVASGKNKKKNQKQSVEQPQLNKQANQQKKQQPRKQKQKQFTKDERPGRQDLTKQGIRQYKMSEWYSRAVKGGFKTKEALERFNASVVDYADDIEKSVIPFCSQCGNGDIQLCECFITKREPAVEIQDDALLIPDIKDSNMSWSFQGFGILRRMFTWPKFDNTALINHSNRGFDPSIIPDDQVWPEMLLYIRLNLNTSYKINGKFDREAKLAHCNKWALRFLADKKIHPTDINTPKLLNTIKLTVARACDQRDDQTLLKETDPRQNFWPAPVLSRFLTFRNVIIAGAIISPVIVSKLVTASMRTQMWMWCRLAQANAEILAFGSVQALKCAVKITADVVSAFQRNIWSGLVQPCWNEIQQSLWPTARTMSTSLCTNVTLRRLQIHSPLHLTWFSSSALLRTWPVVLQTISSNSTQLSFF